MVSTVGIAVGDFDGNLVSKVGNSVEITVDNEVDGLIDRDDGEIVGI